MKRLLMVLGLTVILTGAAFAQMARGATVFVNVKTLQLKSGTGFFAKNQGGPLAYGDQVTVVQVNGKWVEVRYSGRTTVSGWTASANLTTKRIVASNGTGSASAQEIAMAGKGFNEEVENAYKSSGNLNYAAVDATEALKVEESELYDFITEGHLSLGDK
jgi:uncharacterized protein YgiM (DUF1202 family)